MRTIKLILIIIILFFIAVLLFADSHTITREYKTKQDVIKAVDKYIDEGWQSIEITKYRSMENYEIKCWKYIKPK